MYTPNNPSVYMKALAGCLAGLGGAGKFLLDPIAADYSIYARMADAYAQAFDGAWGTPVPTVFELDAIEAASEGVWQGRSPFESAVAFVPNAYSGLVLGAIALVKEGNAQIVNEGIDPNAGGSPPPLGPNAFLNQPTWVVDPSNVSGLANDNNAGDTEAAPLLHYREIARRWGTTSPVITTNDVDMEFMSDLAGLLDPVVCTPVTPNGHKLTIRGKGSPVGAGGVLGVVTPKNPAAGQALDVDLGASAAAAVKMLLLNTPRGSVSYVDSIVAGTNTLVTQPFDAATDSIEDDGYAAGQAFTLLRPTQINIGRIENVTLKRAWLPSAIVGKPIIEATTIIESRIDPITFGEFDSNTVLNSIGFDLNISNTHWTGGALNGSFLHFSITGACAIQGDTIIHGYVAQSGVLSLGSVYTDSFNLYRIWYISGNVFVAVIYGHYILAVQGSGILVYLGGPFGSLAVPTFLGTPSLTFSLTTTGTAIDQSVDPTVLHPRRALTPANLDALIGAGGFNGGAGGVAISDTNLTSRITAFSVY
jgi:hypothetical protein